MTEEENKKQYESFVTSAINSGALDAIVSYREWLDTIQSYTPEQVIAGDNKVRTREEWSMMLKEVGIDFD